MINNDKPKNFWIFIHKTATLARWCHQHYTSDHRSSNEIHSSLEGSHLVFRAHANRQSSKVQHHQTGTGEKQKKRSRSTGLTACRPRLVRDDRPLINWQVTFFITPQAQHRQCRFMAGSRLVWAIIDESHSEPVIYLVITMSRWWLFFIFLFFFFLGIPQCTRSSYVFISAPKNSKALT